MAGKKTKIVERELASLITTWFNEEIKRNKFPFNIASNEALLQKIIDSPNDKNSNLGYYRKYNLSFFPSIKLNPTQLVNDFERLKSKIFQNRSLPYINTG